jgi:hypothetical protein
MFEYRSVQFSNVDPIARAHERESLSRQRVARVQVRRSSQQHERPPVLTPGRGDRTELERRVCI